MFLNTPTRADKMVTWVPKSNSYKSSSPFSPLKFPSIPFFESTWEIGIEEERVIRECRVKKKFHNKTLHFLCFQVGTCSSSTSEFPMFWSKVLYSHCWHSILIGGFLTQQLAFRAELQACCPAVMIISLQTPSGDWATIKASLEWLFVILGLINSLKSGGTLFPHWPSHH